MHKYFFFLLLCLSLSLSCKRSALELEDAPRGPKSRVQAATPSKTNSRDSRHSPNEHHKVLKPLFSFTFKSGKTQFHNLPTAASFVLTPREAKLLEGVLEFLDKWDSQLYSSYDGYEAARFLGDLFRASRKEEHYLPEELRVLRQFALPLFLEKRLIPGETLPLAAKKVGGIAHAYYARGFNLGYPSLKQLDEYLTRFDEAVYKGRRSGLCQREPLVNKLKELSQFLDKREVQDFRKIPAILTHRVVAHPTRVRFSRYALNITPALGGGLTLSLDYYTKGRSSDALYKAVDGALKKPPFTYGIVLPDRQFYERNTIAAAGVCALCFPQSRIPGDANLPRNVRRMGWSTYGQAILNALLEKRTAAELDACVPSLTDLIVRFRTYFATSKGVPGETSSGHRFSPVYTDGQVLKALWVKAFMQFIILSEKLEGGTLRPGCELALTHYAAFRFAIEHSLGKQSSALDTLVNRLYVRGLFARYTKRKKGETADKEGSNTKEAKTFRYPQLHFFFDKGNLCHFLTIRSFYYNIIFFFKFNISLIKIIYF